MKRVFVSFLLTILSSYFSWASSLVYVPENFDTKKARIVTVIHGCLQTPESMALGSGWNQIADRNNLVVVYPQVPTGSNPIDCWSWYDPKNQSRDSGQLKQVQSEISTWKTRLVIQKAPVFVTGISSGAATVAGLLACFPEEFAAGAIHSGPSYGLATSLEEGEKVLKEGPSGVKPKARSCDPSQFQKPVMVLHGTADVVVHVRNVEQIVTDFFGASQVAKTNTDKQNGLSFTVKDYILGKELRGRVVLIDGLGHAWAGYSQNLRHSILLGPSGKLPTQTPFFSPQGPSSSNMIFDFFDSVSKK